MPKSLFVDPAKTREAGKITFRDIDVNVYCRTLEQERERYSDEDLLRIYRDNEQYDQHGRAKCDLVFSSEDGKVKRLFYAAAVSWLGPSWNGLFEVEPPTAEAAAVLPEDAVVRWRGNMGIEALYRRPNTSKPEPGHKIYPYLLRKLPVTRPNHVWAMDITYIPMARGFVYLAAVVDWFSRKVLAWKLSITMDADFCIEAVEEAMTRYGKPEIFNTDQGSQFTSTAFTGLLITNGIRISMDGKGAWRDNVFVERVW